MMKTQNDPGRVEDICVTVATGKEWRESEAESIEARTVGTALDVSVKVFKLDESLQAEALAHEEEVATVLEGSFYIRADDEEYELTVGEGIIIPPGTERLWRCNSPKGVLYRVLTLSQPSQQG
ncbi:MAG TPA: cupin domain-containing protein [Oligella sp.]|nr:cupin domain-containing protein [Oligella sp.]